MRRDESSSREQGAAFATLLVVLLPLVSMAIAAAATMRGRATAKKSGIEMDRALIAAESGVDHVLHLANTDALTLGNPITRTLAPGFAFVATASDLESDGLDNDGDGEIDELDEAIYVVTSTGTFGQARRKLVCYLRAAPEVSLVQSAIHSESSPAVISFDGSSFTVSGDAVDTAGVPTSELAKPGITVASTASPASVTSPLSGAQSAQITGSSASPSVAQSAAPVDVAGAIDSLEAHASNSLTGGSYSSVSSFGTTSDWRITHFNGSTTLERRHRRSGHPPRRRRPHTLGQHRLRRPRARQRQRRDQRRRERDLGARWPDRGWSHRDQRQCRHRVLAERAPPRKTAAPQAPNALWLANGRELSPASLPARPHERYDVAMRSAAPSIFVLGLALALQTASAAQSDRARAKDDRTANRSSPGPPGQAVREQLQQLPLHPRRQERLRPRLDRAGRTHLVNGHAQEGPCGLDRMAPKRRCAKATPEHDEGGGEFGEGELAGHAGKG